MRSMDTASSHCDSINRVALSRELHDFYDGLSYQFSIVTIILRVAEQNRSISNRYKVRTHAVALCGGNSRNEVEVFAKVLVAHETGGVFSH